MKLVWTVLGTVAMSLSLVAASPVRAQSNDDQLSLDKCVGYEACKKIQDKIDAIKAGAGNVADKVSNALTPSGNNRSYFEKFTLDERKEAMAQCEKNYAGRNCEPSYLTPEEIAALHPKKSAPPPNPAADRAWEKQQLEKFDKDVAGILDIKCFTPEMANGANYGDCTAALAQLNRIEKDAKAQGVALRSSALAQQFGFTRKADGTWDDQYAQGAIQQRRVDAVPQKPARATQQQRDACYSDSTSQVQSIAGCTALIEAGEDLPLAYTDRCLAYVQTGNYPPAISDCTKAIALEPKSADPYRARGFAYVGQGLFDQGLADADRAIALQPSATAYVARGLAHAGKSQGDLAIADFRAALQLDPRNKGAADWLVKLGARSEESATSGDQSLNGEWVGVTSGNHVTLEVRTGGIFVTPVTQNVGQAAQGFLYRDAGQKSYRFKFPDGRDSVIQLRGPAELRVTNPDGWTDIFHRVGGAAGLASQARPRTSGGTSTARAPTYSSAPQVAGPEPYSLGYVADPNWRPPADASCRDPRQHMSRDPDGGIWCR